MRTVTGGTARRPLARIRAALHEAWQIARGITGERAYEIYLDHHRRTHPDRPPMGEREFWRWYIDRGDTQPGSRCC
ncbi:YbdD/YjiX family protein [Marinactinospora rubrisoli]|uniref:YbdD/YjiX family protein n=1 Tax=Marinactinospora rubrisoli TaxID=2715399 RepID=A0ABW2KH83_9ACTN